MLAENGLSKRNRPVRPASAFPHHPSCWICLLLLASPAWGDGIEAVHASFSRAYVDIGIAGKQMVLDVSDSATQTTQGELQTEMDIVPFLSLGTAYSYFDASNWGYNFTFSISPFSIDKQLVNENDSDPLDLGTSAKGYFFYASPVFFYHFGDKDMRGHSLKLGIGAGIGYLKAKGDIVYTRSDGQRHKFDISGGAFSVAVLMEYRYRNWLLRATGAGPVLSQDGYDYQFMDITVQMGYSFFF